MEHLGELAGLSCSFLWALCSLAFASAGRRVGASAVNQIRIHIALVALCGLHFATTGAIWPTEISGRQVAGLLISGFVGLALGDLCLFRCMALIGPRLGTLLMATSPAMTATIAWLWLGETLGVLALAGMALVICGVIAVLVDRRAVEGWRSAASGGRLLPVLLGLAGAVGQAVGLILAKDGMNAVVEGEVAIDPLSATVVRMTAGAAGMVGIAVGLGHVRTTVRALGDRLAMAQTAIGAVFGPILGVWMSAVAVLHAEAGIAATLMSLAPVLMIPIGRIAYGARPGPLGVLGTFAAVGGGALLFLR